MVDNKKIFNYDFIRSPSSGSVKELIDIDASSFVMQQANPWPSQPINNVWPWDDPYFLEKAKILCDVCEKEIYLDKTFMEITHHVESPADAFSIEKHRIYFHPQCFKEAAGEEYARKLKLP